MLAPVVENRRLEDQLARLLGPSRRRLDDEANSQITDGGATGSRLRGGTSVGVRVRVRDRGKVEYE
jgi:hypothetical protein